MINRRFDGRKWRPFVQIANIIMINTRIHPRKWCINRANRKCNINKCANASSEMGVFGHSTVRDLQRCIIFANLISLRSCVNAEGVVMEGNNSQRGATLHDCSVVSIDTVLSTAIKHGGSSFFGSGWSIHSLVTSLILLVAHMISKGYLIMEVSLDLAWPNPSSMRWAIKCKRSGADSQ